MDRVNFIPEEHEVLETTFKPDDGERWPASEYNYGPAKFTERQEIFYRNLLTMYRVTGRKKLPVYFETKDGCAMHFDRGCVSMARHEGFIKPLEDDENGILSYVYLNW